VLERLTSATYEASVIRSGLKRSNSRTETIRANAIPYVIVKVPQWALLLICPPATYTDIDLVAPSQVRLARRVAASAKLYCPSSIEAPCHGSIATAERA